MLSQITQPKPISKITFSAIVSTTKSLLFPVLMGNYGISRVWTVCAPHKIFCVTKTRLKLLILSLDSSKASGPDNTSARMLEFTATSIAASITTLSTCQL